MAITSSFADSDYQDFGMNVEDALPASISPLEAATKVPFSPTPPASFVPVGSAAQIFSPQDIAAFITSGGRYEQTFKDLGWTGGDPNIYETVMSEFGESGASAPMSVSVGVTPEFQQFLKEKNISMTMEPLGFGGRSTVMVGGVPVAQYADKASKFEKFMDPIMESVPTILQLAVASTMGPAIGSAITGALGIAASAATKAFIGNVVFNTIQTGGDIEKAVKSSVASWAGAQVGELVGKSASSMFSNPEGLRMISDVANQATRAAILGEDVESAVKNTIVAGAVDFATAKIPGFNDLPSAVKDTVKQSINAAVQGKDIDPGTMLANAAKEGILSYGLNQIPEFKSADPKTQSFISTMLRTAIDKGDLSQAAVNFAIGQARQELNKAIASGKVPDTGDETARLQARYGTAPATDTGDETARLEARYGTAPTTDTGDEAARLEARYGTAAAQPTGGSALTEMEAGGYGPIGTAGTAGITTGTTTGAATTGGLPQLGAITQNALQHQAAEVIARLYPGQNLSWVDQGVLALGAAFIRAQGEQGFENLLRYSRDTGKPLSTFAPPSELGNVLNIEDVDRQKLSIQPPAGTRFIAPGETPDSYGYSPSGQPVGLKTVIGGTGKRVSDEEAARIAAQTRGDEFFGASSPEELQDIEGAEGIRVAGDPGVLGSVVQATAAPFAKGAGEIIGYLGTGAEALGLRDNILQRAGGDLTSYGVGITPRRVLEQQDNIIGAISKADGALGKLAAAVSAGVMNPLGLLDWTVSEGFQELFPLGTAATIGRGLTTAARLRYGDALASRMGITAAVGTNAAMDAGESALASYQSVYSELKNRGYSDEAAASAASKSAAASGLITLFTSAVSERPIVEAITRNLPTAAGRNMLREGFFGGAEEFGQSISEQLGVSGKFDMNEALNSLAIGSLLESSTAGGISAGQNILAGQAGVGGGPGVGVSGAQVGVSPSGGTRIEPTLGGDTSGAVTADVTGQVTGDISGDLTGGGTTSVTGGVTTADLTGGKTAADVTTVDLTGGKTTDTTTVGDVTGDRTDVSGERPFDPTSLYQGYTDAGESGAFGRKDIEQLISLGASPEQIRSIANQFSSRGLTVGPAAQQWLTTGSFEAAKPVAFDPTSLFPGYTDPGDKGAFGRKDVEELVRLGATPQQIQAIASEFASRGMPVGAAAQNWLNTGSFEAAGTVAGTAGTTGATTEAGVTGADTGVTTGAVTGAGTDVTGATTAGTQTGAATGATSGTTDAGTTVDVGGGGTTIGGAGTLADTTTGAAGDVVATGTGTAAVTAVGGTSPADTTAGATTGATTAGSATGAAVDTGATNGVTTAGAAVNATQADVSNIVNNAVASNPAVSADQVKSAVETAIASNPGTSLADINTAVSTATTGLSDSSTATQVQNAVNTAVAEVKQQADVTKIVNDALAANPGLNIGDVQAVVNQAIANIPAGLTTADVNAAISSSLSALPASVTPTQMQQAVSTAVGSLQADVSGQIGTLQQNLTTAIADARSAGLQGDAALQAGIDQVASNLGTTRESLLAQLGQTEQSLRSQLQTEIGGVQQQIGQLSDQTRAQLEAQSAQTQSQFNQLSAAQQAQADALVQQGQSLTSAINQVQTGLAGQITALSQQTQSQLAAQSAQTQSQFNQLSAAQQAQADALVQQGQSLTSAINQVQTGLTGQITALSQQTQQQLAQQSAQTQQQFNQLSSAQQAQADALVQQGQSLSSAINQVQTGLTGQITALSQQTQQQLAQQSAQTQQQFNQLTAAQQQQADALVRQGESLGSAINQVQTGLTGQISALSAQTQQQLASQSAQTQSQFNQLSEAQKAQADALVQQGQSLSSAINQVQTGLTDVSARIDQRIDALIQQGLDTRTATEVALNEMRTSQTQSNVVLNQRIDTLMQQGMDYQAASQKAISELGGGLGALEASFGEYAKQQAEAREQERQAQQKAQEQARSQNMMQQALTTLGVAGAAAGPVQDYYAKFKDPFVTRVTTEKFVSPLESYLKEVKSPSGDEFLADTTKQQDRLQQESPMDYFNYGTVQSVDDILRLDQPEGAFGFKAGGPAFAGGGALNVVNFAGKPRIDFRHGSAVNGPGDGQSDDIPAMLADGEYVFDAESVAALGNGSTKAGAEALDKMRMAIRKHKRSGPLDSIPPPSKSPLEYLKMGNRGKRG